MMGWNPTTKSGLNCVPVFLDRNCTITDANIYDAVGLWIVNESEAKQIFGPIALWNTSSITTMNDCTASHTICSQST